MKGCCFVDIRLNKLNSMWVQEFRTKMDRTETLIYAYRPNLLGIQQYSYGLDRHNVSKGINHNSRLHIIHKVQGLTPNSYSIQPWMMFYEWLMNNMKYYYCCKPWLSPKTWRRYCILYFVIFIAYYHAAYTTKCLVMHTDTRYLFWM